MTEYERLMVNTVKHSLRILATQVGVMHSHILIFETQIKESLKELEAIKDDS